MLPKPEHFIACPVCSCHAKPHENACPHCGATLRRKDGSLPRTTAAMLMGLTAIALPALGAGAACSGSETGGQGGGGGSSSSMVSTNMATAYGVAASSSGDPQTDNDMDGYFAPGNDCNDNDANVHPNASETPGDMIDSNCNGDDNT